MKKFLPIIFAFWGLIASSQAQLVDLSQHDFNQNPLTNINGDWEIFWGVVRTPKQLEDLNNEETNIVSVPGNWEKMVKRYPQYKKQGASTYRVRVKLPENHPPLAIRFHRIYSAHKVFIDGQELGEVGKVASNPEEAQMNIHRKIWVLPNQGHEFELVLQVSNYNWHWGGIWRDILIGPVETLMAKRSRSLAHDLTLFGVTFVMGLYHIGLFLLRRKNRSTLWFSAICLIMSYRILMTGERFIGELFPNFFYEAMILEGVLSVLIPVIAQQFFRHLYPEIFNRWWTVPTRVVSLSLAMVYLIFPPPHSFGTYAPHLHPDHGACGNGGASTGGGRLARA